jgi:hypothetical protein
MRRHGPPLRAPHGVELAAVQRLALFGVPDPVDDVDGLGHRIHRFARGESTPAHRLDGVPESAGAEAEAEAAAGEKIEGCGGPRQHRRLAQREVGDVRCELDRRCRRGDVRQQRPCVVEPRLIRVILEGDQVVAEALAVPRELDRSLRRRVPRRDERAELEVVTVVHATILFPERGREQGPLSAR